MCLPRGLSVIQIGSWARGLLMGAVDRTFADVASRTEFVPISFAWSVSHLWILILKIEEYESEAGGLPNRLQDANSRGNYRTHCPGFRPGVAGHAGRAASPAGGQGCEQGSNVRADEGQPQATVAESSGTIDVDKPVDQSRVKRFLEETMAKYPGCTPSTPKSTATW